MTDTESALQALHAARAACDAGIAAAEQGMAETKILGDFYADYERQKADWLLCRAAVDRRIAELTKTKRRMRRQLQEIV